MREVLEAEVVFLDPPSGGRSTPPILQKYRLTFTIEGYAGNEHVGIGFYDGPADFPGFGVPFVTTVTLLFFPHEWYERLAPNSRFNIQEGPQIVGRGKVLSDHRRAAVVTVAGFVRDTLFVSYHGLGAYVPAGATAGAFALPVGVVSYLVLMPLSLFARGRRVDS